MPVSHVGRPRLHLTLTKIPLSCNLVNMSLDMATQRLSEALAANVRREMEARGWTQAELARRCGWAPARITEVLSGDFNYRFATAEKLAEAFGVQPVALLLTPAEQTA